MNVIGCNRELYSKFMISNKNIFTIPFKICYSVKKHIFYNEQIRKFFIF